MKLNASIMPKILQKIPLKYFTLILSITGVIFLYALSLFQQPIILTSFDSLEDYEGKEVTLTGIIIDQTITSYGSQLITLQCNSTQLTVFSDSPFTIHAGDTFQGTGTIQEYKDSWELILSNPKAATILTTWQNTTINIKDLAEHPKNYLNIPVNISGTIDIVYDSIIYIKDETGNYTIPFLPENNPIPKPGTNVSLQATLTYEPHNLRYLLTECTLIQHKQNTPEG